MQSSGCVLKESEGAVQWVCSGGNQKVWSSGCVLKGIRGCGPVGVFWRESEGEVQWVFYGGNQRVWSNGCVLEGIRGCGPVGVSWRESEGLWTSRSQYALSELYQWDQGVWSGNGVCVL